jgi:hypothetical protein
VNTKHPDDHANRCKKKKKNSINRATSDSGNKKIIFFLPHQHFTQLYFILVTAKMTLQVVIHSP